MESFEDFDLIVGTHSCRSGYLKICDKESTPLFDLCPTTLII